MRLLAHLVGVVLLVGFVGAYFWWIVVALAAVAPVYLESACAVAGSDEHRVPLRMPGRSGPANVRGSTADENVLLLGDQGDRLDLGSELLPDTLSSS